MRKLLLCLCLLSFCLAGCQTVKEPIKDTKKREAMIVTKEAAQERKKEITAANTSFDLKTGEIRYTLPEEAFVRIRVGLREGGPLLDHVIDWQKRAAGAHLDVWDKKDHEGGVEFSTRGDYMLILACLPVNETERKNYSSKVKGFHTSPRFEITFPDVQRRTPDGFPIIGGITPVRITLDKDDEQWLTNTKYELGMYIDYTFLMEDEEGTSPFTYRLDTRRMNNGEHILTVNLVGYEGEVGTRSVKVLVHN
jgi:hypothetical protein